MAVQRPGVRVESERSLRSGVAILDVVDGVARAKHIPERAPSYEGITEVTVDELVESVTATIQRRLCAGATASSSLNTPRRCLAATTQHSSAFTTSSNGSCSNDRL